MLPSALIARDILQYDLRAANAADNPNDRDQYTTVTSYSV